MAEIVSFCVGILAVIVIATVTAIIVCFCLRYITIARCWLRKAYVMFNKSTIIL